MAAAAHVRSNFIMMIGFLVLVHYSVNSNGNNAIAATFMDSQQAPLASLNKSNFPEGFIFGTASSAYQYEGGVSEDGRGPSIWDTYTRIHPEKIRDGSNGNVAVDSYHRFKEDVAIMKDIGVDAHRFSISWSRVLPYGKLSAGVNREGIAYYNNLIDELLANGIQPFGTLFHWDLPQVLEDEYGGFLSHRIVDDFRDYAEVCFREFGDRVKHWITINEPWTYSSGGYDTGIMPPMRCSHWRHLNCTGGDSGTEPYLVTHHQLLAHAAAVQVYRQRYQASQKGDIGITLVSVWFVPLSNSKKHHRAAQRAQDFFFGWFMEPLTMGEYPQSMRNLVGERLPKFSKEQIMLLNGSFDFLGLNYYTSNYASHVPNNSSSNATNTNGFDASYSTDAHARLSAERNGVLIGPQTAAGWLYIYPKGLRNILRYTKRKYSNPVIYITENGTNEANNGTLSVKEALADNARIDYHLRHLSSLLDAIEEDGVDVRGYFAWSLLDNFEWNSGYSIRFGLYYVYYKDGLNRTPKLSAHWFSNFLTN